MLNVRDATDLAGLGQGKTKEGSLAVTTGATLALALCIHLESLHSSSCAETLAVLLGCIVIVGVLVLLDSIWQLLMVSMLLICTQNCSWSSHLPHQGPRRRACSASVLEHLECCQRGPCHQMIRPFGVPLPWRCRSRRFRP